MEVNIPFLPRFHIPLKDGVKTMTCRPKKMAKPGDFFRIEDQIFNIVSVEQIPLGFVADFYWKQEGCSSKEEFIKIWEQIHPFKGFVEEQYVFLHKFQKAKTI